MGGAREIWSLNASVSWQTRLGSDDERLNLVTLNTLNCGYS